MTTPEMKKARARHKRMRELKDLWVEHGGSQHGPHTETMTIPEANFAAFMDAALPHLPSDGKWKLAPVEPDERMLNAARDWSIKKNGMGVGNDQARGCYGAMIAAAPLPAPPGSEVPAGQGVTVKAERDALAQAIGDAAVKAGITSPDAALTLPHLIMVVGELSALTTKTPEIRREALKEAASYHEGCAQNGYRQAAEATSNMDRVMLTQLADLNKLHAENIRALAAKEGEQHG